MTEHEILDILKHEQKLQETQAAYARRMGVTPQYLHDVFNRRRNPGPKILKFLGVEKIEEYVFVKSNGNHRQVRAK